jgi:hypothetical protein
MIREAIFSDCGKYRYLLVRVWNPELKPLVCFGLNPSTANAESDDPTIKNLVRLLQNEGYGSLYMMNLFALVSPYPDDLRTCPDPVKENDDWIAKICMGQDVAFCWGNFKQAEYRAKKVKKMFNTAKCFGKNANGSPKHPLYLKSNTKLIDY